jgi:hypothetical protein
MIQKIIGSVALWILFKIVVPIAGWWLDYYRLKRKEKDETQ